MLTIYVDADACPVKAEIYKVAGRTGCKVVLVSNAPLRLPTECQAELVVVGSEFDAADNWIAEHAGGRDIVITADIPLADRAIKNGAVVIGNSGRPFTPDSIGSALATRALMADLRAMGEVSGNNAPMGQRDRSQFLQTLDQAVQALKAGRQPKWR
ncbi:MAG TPA: YaiI/YqxD family protein [Azospirillum sp.]|nr:YaiI/YqxD family protein [Azospirillum sp.]